MNYIFDDVSAAIAAQKIEAHCLPRESERVFRSKVVERLGFDPFGVPEPPPPPSVEWTSYHGANVWSWIGEFTHGREVFLLIEDYPQTWQFAHGEDIVAVLGETTGYTFHVCDANVDFLLTYNHHDVLIACGTATPWLRGRANAEKTGG